MGSSGELGLELYHVSEFLHGRLKGKIFATSGLRQGDLLSSFLFLMVDDVLSRLISSRVENGVIEGFKVGKDLVHLSHLQTILSFFFWDRQNLLII